MNAWSESSKRHAQRVLVARRRGSLLTRSVGLSAVLSSVLGGVACGPETSAEQRPTRPTEPARKLTQHVVAEDGDATLADGTSSVNGYTTLAQDASGGATELIVADVADLTVAGLGPLTAGDLVLVYQAQGASISPDNEASYGSVTALGNAGRYELVEVSGISDDTLSLSCALANSYVAMAGTQVIRVPQYSTLTVPASATLTAPA